MAHYSRFEVGPMNAWSEQQFTHPVLAQPVRGKSFLGEALQLTSMEVSLNSLPPKVGLPFLHNHRNNEELYLFLSGHGQFQVDGEVFPITSGSAVRVSPAGHRGLRNTGDQPLVYIVVQAPAGKLDHGTITDGVRLPGDVVWPS